MVGRFIAFRERFLVGSLALSVLAPEIASAQSIERPSGVPPIFGTFQSTFRNIFNIVIVVAGILFVALFLFGGVQYLTAAGSDDATKKARQLMLDAVIGLVIVLTSWGVGTYILTLLQVPGAANGQLPTTIN